MHSIAKHSARALLLAGAAVCGSFAMAAAERPDIDASVEKAAQAVMQQYAIRRVASNASTTTAWPPGKPNSR